MNISITTHDNKKNNLNTNQVTVFVIAVNQIHNNPVDI